MSFHAHFHDDSSVDVTSKLGALARDPNFVTVQTRLFGSLSGSREGHGAPWTQQEET